MTLVFGERVCERDIFVLLLCSAVRPPLREEARGLCVPASRRVCLFAERSRARAYLKVIMLLSGQINTSPGYPRMKALIYDANFDANAGERP
jgi:hypothetical protein